MKLSSRLLLPLALGMAHVFFMTTALAQEFQSVASIRAAALSIVPDRDAEGVQAEVRLDPSLRLPACSVDLQAHASSNGTAEVACPEPGWKLYVLINIQRLQSIVVLSRTVAAGELLSTDNTRLERRDISHLPGGSVGDPVLALGRIARRTLMAGSILAPQDLISARMVRRGDGVTLVVRHAGMEVRAAGRALADAGKDERLSVENLSSRRMVQGVVQDNGEVLVR